MALIMIYSVLGNIFRDRRLSIRYRRKMAAGACEVLPVSRVEMERQRLRRKTDRGTDMGVVLEPGKRLEKGDVLVDSKGKFIMVEQLPEKVISITIKEQGVEELVELSALIGHVVGNRHRPIAVGDGKISFPILADSELELFRRLLPTRGIQLRIEDKIFQPSGNAIHKHDSQT
jgi:urease accessory protein